MEMEKNIINQQNYYLLENTKMDINILEKNIIVMEI